MLDQDHVEGQVRQYIAVRLAGKEVYFLGKIFTPTAKVYRNRHPTEVSVRVQVGVLPPGTRSMTLESVTLDNGDVMKDVSALYFPIGLCPRFALICIQHVLITSFLALKTTPEVAGMPAK